MKSKLKKYLSYLKWWFLGVDEMKKFYPVLEKAPFLLPFCWVHKGVKTLIFKPKAIKNQLTLVTKTSKEIEDIYKISGL